MALDALRRALPVTRFTVSSDLAFPF